MPFLISERDPNYWHEIRQRLYGNNVESNNSYWQRMHREREEQRESDVESCLKIEGDSEYAPPVPEPYELSITQKGES